MKYSLGLQKPNAYFIFLFFKKESHFTNEGEERESVASAFTFFKREQESLELRDPAMQPGLRELQILFE